MYDDALATALRGVLGFEERLSEVGEADLIIDYHHWDDRPSTVDVDLGHSEYGEIGHIEAAWPLGGGVTPAPRFHAIATPHVPRRPNPSGPVPPFVVTAHRASPYKQRKQLVFWLFFGVIAVRCG